MEITRSGILRDCLEEANREMHKYSRHNAGLLPLEGYENHFADLSAKCAMLRAMILETESREAETKNDTDPRTSKPLAQWQKEIMERETEPPRPHNMNWNPETGSWEPFFTPDEALLRRRYRKAEGFKPAPVIYPGGEE